MNNLKLNNIIYIIIIILLFIIIYYLYNKNENFDNAFDTIVNKYYKNDIITMNNLNVTGNLNFGALKGVIVAWSGLVTNIPSGWGLCDGTTYKALDSSQLQSPDLRGKFILGASKLNTSNNGIIDGWGPSGQPNIPNNNKPLPLTPQQPYTTGGAETHTLTLDELPSHTHVVSEVLSWHRGVHGPISSGNSGHSSATTTGTTGGGQPHNNIPPYYSLLYIIKL
jgi:microcystin-dependent protein